MEIPGGGMPPRRLREGSGPRGVTPATETPPLRPRSTLIVKHQIFIVIHRKRGVLNVSYDIPLHLKASIVSVTCLYQLKNKQKERFAIYLNVYISCCKKDYHFRSVIVAATSSYICGPAVDVPTRKNAFLSENKVR